MWPKGNVPVTKNPRHTRSNHNLTPSLEQKPLTKHSVVGPPVLNAVFLGFNLAPSSLLAV